jgi:hypothetical protein
LVAGTIALPAGRGSPRFQPHQQVHRGVSRRPDRQCRRRRQWVPCGPCRG